MSLLRLAGLAAATAILYTVGRALARRSPTAADLLGFAAGLSLVAVSLFPGVVDLPAGLANLGNAPGGRLIALLVLSNLVLWPYIFWSNERHRRSLERLRRQLEALAGRVAAGAAPSAVAPVAVVIPAYEEEETVGAVVRGLPASVRGLAVQAVVVVDGGVDGTAEEARRAGAVVLELPVNHGAGAAIRLGYAYAAGAGAHVIVTMDADGQHRPEDLPALVAPVLEGRADFVVGSRRLGAYEQVSRLRSAGLGCFNAVLGFLLATRLTDCSSGYRAFDARRLPRLTTREDQYHTAETILLVRRLGLRVAEVAITVPRRHAGESKKGGDLVYGYRFARALLSHWLRG
jgi:hypothetical protein